MAKLAALLIDFTRLLFVLLMAGTVVMKPVCYDELEAFIPDKKVWGKPGLFPARS